MNIINFLEELANKVHNPEIIDELINKQSENVKKAILENDNESLKKLISNIEYFADPKTIAEL